MILFYARALMCHIIIYYYKCGLGGRLPFQEARVNNQQWCVKL